MPINVKKLRAKIYENYCSQSDFSRALGWDCNRINRILQKKVTPDIDACAEIAGALCLTPKEYYQIFLPNLSPFGDESNLNVG